MNSYSDKSRIKKQKPFSMNEEMLGKIVQDVTTANENTKLTINSNTNKITVNRIAGCSITKKNSYIINTDEKVNTIEGNSSSNFKVNNTSNSIKRKINLNQPPLKINTNANAIKSLNKSRSSLTKMGLSGVNSSISSLNNSTHPVKNELNINIPSNRNKIPANGLETICSSLSSVGHNVNTSHRPMKTDVFQGSVASSNRPLKTDISQGSITSSANGEKEKIYPQSYNNYLIKSTSTNNDTKTFKSDIFKLNEELLESKLTNAKLKNEMNILYEKIKTLKQVISMKNSEGEMIKTKYSEMTEDYRKEIEKMQKINTEYSNMKMSFSHQNIYIKSTLSVLIDLLEIFITPRSNMNNFITKQSINNTENVSASYSIDIYDSYNNDEERRNTIIDQIQGLLISKLNVLKINMKIELDKEIDRVKNWNYSRCNNSEINFSNLKISKQIDNNESSESLKKLNSEDLFDLSTSNQYIGMSPKFNSLDVSVKKTKSVINKFNYENELGNNFSLKKLEDENQILNDSFLKDLKNSNILFN